MGIRRSYSEEIKWKTIKQKKGYTNKTTPSIVKLCLTIEGVVLFD